MIAMIEFLDPAIELKYNPFSRKTRSGFVLSLIQRVQRFQRVGRVGLIGHRFPT